MRPKAFTRSDMATHIAKAHNIRLCHRRENRTRQWLKKSRYASKTNVIPRDVAKWHGKAVDFPAGMASGRNWCGFLGLSDTCYAYRESGRKANVTRIAARTDNYQQPIVISFGVGVAWINRARASESEQGARNASERMRARRMADNAKIIDSERAN